MVLLKGDNYLYFNDGLTCGIEVLPVGSLTEPLDYYEEGSLTFTVLLVVVIGFCCVSRM